MEDITNIPQHIAIIMDGNRRWAKVKGVQTSEGHKAGQEQLMQQKIICLKLQMRVEN